MTKCISFTEAECRALYEVLAPECLLDDGSRDISDLTKLAVAKIYAAVGEDIPDRLKQAVLETSRITHEHDGVLGQDIAALGLPYGVESRLKNGHFRTYDQINPLEKEIRIVADLVEYSGQSLTEHGFAGRSVDDIRAALAKVGLKLKGE